MMQPQKPKKRSGLCKGSASKLYRNLLSETKADSNLLSADTPTGTLDSCSQHPTQFRPHPAFSSGSSTLSASLMFVT